MPGWLGDRRTVDRWIKRAGGSVGRVVRSWLKFADGSIGLVYQRVSIPIYAATERVATLVRWSLRSVSVPVYAATERIATAIRWTIRPTLGPVYATTERVATLVRWVILPLTRPVYAATERIATMVAWAIPPLAAPVYAASERVAGIVRWTIAVPMLEVPVFSVIGRTSSAVISVSSGGGKRPDGYQVWYGTDPDPVANRVSRRFYKGFGPHQESLGGRFAGSSIWYFVARAVRGPDIINPTEVGPWTVILRVKIGDEPPIWIAIPNQLANLGADDTVLNIYDKVADSNNEDSTLTIVPWSDDTDVVVPSISGGILTLDWGAVAGSATVTLTATDPDGNEGKGTVLCILNDPCAGLAVSLDGEIEDEPEIPIIPGDAKRSWSVQPAVFRGNRVVLQSPNRIRMPDGLVARDGGGYLFGIRLEKQGTNWRFSLDVDQTADGPTRADLVTDWETRSDALQLNASGRTLSLPGPNSGSWAVRDVMEPYIVIATDSALNNRIQAFVEYVDGLSVNNLNITATFYWFGKP